MTMREWTQNGTEWTSEGCTAFVYREGTCDSATFDPERPYVVATTEYGEPTGEDGRYETFSTLRAALSRASFRHDERTGAL